MQSSPVAAKKLTALKAYAKKNGMVVSKPVDGKVTLSAVWSETTGTFAIRNPRPPQPMSFRALSLLLATALGHVVLVNREHFR